MQATRERDRQVDLEAPSQGEIAIPPQFPRGEPALLLWLFPAVGGGGGAAGSTVGG